MSVGMTRKAGVSWPVQEGTSDPVAKFFQPGSKLSWHWNWNKNWNDILEHTTPDLQIDAEFVPMIFAPDHLNNEHQIQEGWKIMMGFNEPDHGDATVAVKTTPAEAASAWVELARLRSGAQQLASPAVAWNIEWMKEFLALIPADTRPDYLTIHVYTTTYDDFVRRVEEYRRVFQLPIILSEFAMQSFDPNVPPPSSQQQVHDFMGQTTKWLDETDYIIKYSWFGAVRNAHHLHGVHPFNRLMDEQGEITPLGWQYIRGGHD